MSSQSVETASSLEVYIVMSLHLRNHRAGWALQLAAITQSFHTMTTESEIVFIVIQQKYNRLLYENVWLISAGRSIQQLPDHILDDLSSDQQYLSNTVETIRQGQVIHKVYERKPSMLRHSQWLAGLYTENKLKLYV